MSNIIIGDVAQGQKWWGVANQVKRQLLAIYRQNNSFMETWKQVDKDTKIFAKIVNGQAIAYIYAGVTGWVYQFFVSEGDPDNGYYVAWAEIPMDDMALWDAIIPNDLETYPKAKLTPTTLSSKFERAALHPYQPTQCVNKWVGATKTGFGVAVPSYDAWVVAVSDHYSATMGVYDHSHDAWIAAMTDNGNFWFPTIGVYNHAVTALPFAENSQIDNAYLAYYQQQSIAEFNGALVTMSPIGLCGIKRDDGWHWYYTVASPLANGSPAAFYWKFSSDGSKVCGYSLDYSDSHSQAITELTTKYVEHTFYVDGDGKVQVQPGTVIATPVHWGSCVGVDYLYGTTTLVMLTLESPFNPSTEMSIHQVVSGTETVWKRKHQVCLSVKLINVGSASVIYTTQIGYEENGYGRTDGRGRRKKIAGYDLSQQIIAFGYEYSLTANDYSSTRACYDVVDMSSGNYIYQQSRPGGWSDWAPEFANRTTISSSDYDVKTIDTTGWSTPSTYDGVHVFFTVKSNEGDSNPSSITKWLTPAYTTSYWQTNTTGSFAVFSNAHVRFDVYKDQNVILIALYERGTWMGVDLLLRINGVTVTAFDGFHRDVIGKSTDRVITIDNSNASWINSDHRSINPGYAAGLVFTRPSGLTL